MTPVQFTLACAACILGSYLIGAIPFGLLIGKLVKGIDIRKEGSGNIGATNVTRVVGKIWGKVCFLLDFAKGAVPVILVSYLTPKVILPGVVERLPESIRQFSGCIPDSFGCLPAIAAFAVVAGHIWPIYIGFKGGKGVSTAAGAILALNPISLLASGAVWVVVFFLSRYVSLASILAAFSLPVFCFFFRMLHFTQASHTDLILFGMLAALTIVKHTSNIKRLINGTENRFEKKGKKES